MTGHELRSFLGDLSWEEMEHEVLFCDSLEGLGDPSSKTCGEVAGGAIIGDKIVLLANKAASSLQDQFGTDEYGMEDKPE
jgi:hypothetical protein